MPHLPKCQPFIPLKLHSVSVTASRPTGLANRHYVKFRSVAGLVSQLPRPTSASRPPRALQPRHKLWHTTIFYSQRALRVCSLRSFAPPTPAAAGASRLCRVWAWAYPSAPKGLPYTQALTILQRGGFSSPLRPLRGRGYCLVWRSTPPFFGQIVPHSLWSVKARPCGLINRARWSPYFAAWSRGFSSLDSPNSAQHMAYYEGWGSRAACGHISLNLINR
jgi:hypothetical protein